MEAPQTQSDSLRLESILIDAEKQLILENYEKALEGFNVALKMNPESAAINYKLAEVLSLSNEGKKALSYGLRAIEIDPDNKYYRLALARIYKSVGFHIESAKTYEGVLEKYPANESALYELAELYQLTGRIDDMMAVFNQIEKELGINEDIIREKQRIYMKEGKVDLVVMEYEKLIEAYPNEQSYQIEFISFLIQNKKLDQASQQIALYEENEVTSARITLLKSEVAWIRRDYGKSLDLLEQAFESPTIDFESKFQILSNYFLSSASPGDYKRLAEITIGLASGYPKEYKAQAFVADMLYRQGEKEKSLEYYLKAIRLSPSNFSVWKNILNIEGELSLTDSMVVHAEEALEYFPNQALLYYFAGTGHLIKKNFEKAVRFLNTGRKYTADPKLLTVLYGQLGDAYNGLEQNDKSYDAFEKALMNDSNNDHVLNNYSYFLSLEGKNLHKAIEMSSRLINEHPENPTYLDTHGWVLYANGEYKEARKYLEKAAQSGEDGIVIEHYGDVLFQLGEVEAAIEQWKKAKQLGGASELIDQKIADRKIYE